MFAYTVESSKDGKTWETLLDKPSQTLEQWQGTNRILHPVDTKARYLRLTFTEATDEARPGLSDFRVFAEPTANDYYDVTYDYRLRWDEVAYEAGALKAVAYKDGKIVGETSVETTGKPVAVRLTAERSQVAADGQDLIYVTAEAVDSQGRPCPLANNEITFSVEGAGTFEATGNGDQRSFVAFNSPVRKLFYGKAQLIARPNTGSGGTITITATADGLKTASTEVTSK